jgi:hypothetical protein
VTRCVLLLRRCFSILRRFLHPENRHISSLRGRLGNCAWYVTASDMETTISSWRRRVCGIYPLTVAFISHQCLEQNLRASYQSHVLMMVRLLLLGVFLLTRGTLFHAQCYRIYCRRAPFPHQSGHGRRRPRLHHARFPYPTLHKVRQQPHPLPQPSQQLGIRLPLQPHRGRPQRHHFPALPRPERLQNIEHRPRLVNGRLQLHAP